MLSNLPKPISIDCSPSGLEMIGLIDQIIRLAGRLTSARKMTSDFAGMSTAHWLVLTSVCRATQPPTVARVARSFGHSRQAVQRIANALAERGFISLVENVSDGRAKLMITTRKGREAFAVADREGLQWASQLAADIAPQSIKAAADVLFELRHRLERTSRRK
jgi:DNA-binding MarR family transcriptional regulator